MNKILLQEPRVGGAPPEIGAGHALQIWISGKYLSEKNGMDWITSIEGQKITEQKSEFLDFFGFNKILKKDLFDEYKMQLNIKTIPADGRWKGYIKNQEQIQSFIEENQDCDGFLLQQRNSICCPLNIKDDAFKSTCDFLKQTKGAPKRSLCNKDYFNISIMIRRGDKVFIPLQRDKPDEWFLEEMESRLKTIQTNKPIKVFIFAECYNESWWWENQVFNKNLAKSRQWNMDDIHPEGRSLVEDFRNKNFEKIKDVYVNHEGKPTDIEKIFGRYDSKLCLNENLFVVLDTHIDADMSIHFRHGTARISNIFK